MSSPEAPFTPISEVGEFGLIDRIRSIVGTKPSERVITGIGDDAAVLRPGGGELQLVTTDALIEGVHFDRTFTPMSYLGFKSLAVNVSDIAAMNGQAVQAVVVAGLPNNISVEMVEALYGGMKQAADAYGVDIVGGDSTAAHALTLAVTVLGRVWEQDVCYRSGASAGDFVCVSGDLGSAYAGLKTLLSQKHLFAEQGEHFQPDLEPFRYVVQRQLMPQARTDLIRDWKRLGVRPTSLIDVSDGLASEIHHICDASACGAVIRADTVPVHEQTVRIAESAGEAPIRYALYGGEDYELLFTMTPEDVERCAGLPISVVGEITPESEGVRLMAPAGDSEVLERSGFRHF